MKKLEVVLALLLIACPVLADKKLKPDTEEAAKSQFKAFWMTSDPQSYSDVTWKLYVYDKITPYQGIQKSPEWLLAGLSEKPGYFVYISMNHLYNSLNVMPKAHDQLIIHGRLMRKGHRIIYYKSNRKDVNAVDLDPLEAELVTDPAPQK